MSSHQNRTANADDLVPFPAFVLAMISIFLKIVAAGFVLTGFTVTAVVFLAISVVVTVFSVASLLVTATRD